MSDTDLIILVIFLICVAYVVSRAIDDLEAQTRIDFDKKDLETQLEAMTLGEVQLKDIVEVSFKFEDRYKHGDQPKMLGATIKNKSKNVQIYADWDKSTLTDFGTPSRRVIRLNGDKQITSTNRPIGSQFSSPVTPGTSLSAQLTAEDIMKPNPDKNVLEPSAPLVDLDELEKKAKDKKASKEIKDLNSNFKDRKAHLDFSLRLMLKMNLLDEGGGKEHQYPLWCKFKVINMPWWDHIPWNPKK
ncbi:MAG: hypothetical protein KME15_07065 [Drouetiella hepatica Uher 2000/2452]|jgi:hypothetical protein|uniref:Uncharacterized protein n=1 Tax=Drouetiella hepatica Uher 2000/2452 TaxID=904376 RepID=A0A951UL74_9CYAN|nr:hypothetical protein [Drouetiella hepatica Uher 2000/2452]